MSFTPEDILTIQAFLAQRLESVAEIDFVIPSPLGFSEKADFFNILSPKLTQKEIEKTLIRAGWLSYLTFETDGNIKHPLYALVFEITVAHEFRYEKLDNTDGFKKKLLKSNQEHLYAVFGAVSEFEEGVNITGPESDFDVLKASGLTQSEYSKFGNFAYLPSVQGFQTKLTCRVTARNKC